MEIFHGIKASLDYFKELSQQAPLEGSGILVFVLAGVPAQET